MKRKRLKKPRRKRFASRRPRRNLPTPSGRWNWRGDGRSFQTNEAEQHFILRSAEARNYAATWIFITGRKIIYYLTNLNQNGVTLALIKNGESNQEFLFLPKRNPQFETWNGRMYSNEDAQEFRE